MIIDGRHPRRSLRRKHSSLATEEVRSPLAGISI